MTKKLTFLAAIPMLLIGLSSCSHDDDLTPQGDEKELRIATRSNAEGESTTDSETTFTRDFNLDLWNSDGYERHAMSCDNGNGTWNVVKTSKLDDNTVAAAIAGTAGSIDETDDGYDITVPFDQRVGSVDDYDMMFAYNKEVNSSDALSLHFEHLFVKLTFKIEYGSEYDGTPPTFAYVGINPNGYLYDKAVFSGIQNGNSTPTYSKTSKTVSTVINCGEADVHTDDKIEVIVGYGTILAETEFLKLYKEDDYTNPLVVKAPEGGLTFEKGKHYTFNLKVGKDKVTLTPTATNDHPGGWNNDTETDLN